MSPGKKLHPKSRACFVINELDTLFWNRRPRLTVESVVIFRFSDLKFYEYETGGIRLSPEDSFVGTIVVPTLATLDVEPALDDGSGEC